MSNDNSYGGLSVAGRGVGHRRLHPHSPGRGYDERKLAEAKTRREAIRARNRRLSDIAWRHLIADAQRHAVR